MTKYSKILFRLPTLLFLLLPSLAFAVGTTNLTSYYPPPTAAYNKVNIATNFTPTNGTANPFCTGSNNGTIYFDTGTNILSVCTNTNTSSPANGTIHTDSSGTLHVTMNGQDVIYPQECFNAFCSYANNSASNPCINASGQLLFSCPTGFTQQTPIDQQNDTYDAFNADANTTALSIVCCAGYGSGYTNTSVSQTTFVTSLSVTAVSAEVPNLVITNADFPVAITTWSTSPTVTGPSPGTVTVHAFPTFSFSPTAGGTLKSGRYLVSAGVGGKMFYFYPSLSSLSGSGTLSLSMPIDLAILAGYYGSTCSVNANCGSSNCLPNGSTGICGLPSGSPHCAINQIWCGSSCCTSGQFCCTNGCSTTACQQNGTTSSTT